MRSFAPLRLALLFAVVFHPSLGATQSDQSIRFITLPEAQPAIKALSHDGSDPKILDVATTAKWPSWIRDHDQQIRQRLVRGQEDTISNLLRSGDSFTTAPRIGIRQLLNYNADPAVRSALDLRLTDLIGRLAQPGADQHLLYARAFLQSRGFEFNAPAQKDRLRSYLLANLLRMRSEYIDFISGSSQKNPFEIFQNRGISLDTNLWPDYLIYRHLQHLLQAGVLHPGSIRRVAIVGPGLDFANKEDGTDFYPPQTNQPFAVADSLIRLGLADSDHLEISTLDISQEVNSHIAWARQQASRGRPYRLQLPWDSGAPLDPGYRAGFVAYWKTLGDAVGTEITPINVPENLAGRIQTKAVEISPRVVDEIHPIDIDVVCQHLNLPKDQRFDLVIGTNVFLYYGTLDQLLLRSNIAMMLAPGGLLLSNDKLPDPMPSTLTNSITTSQVVGKAPEFMFTYQLAH